METYTTTWGETFRLPEFNGTPKPAVETPPRASARPHRRRRRPSTAPSTVAYSAPAPILEGDALNRKVLRLQDAAYHHAQMRDKLELTFTTYPEFSCYIPRANELIHSYIKLQDLSQYQWQIICDYNSVDGETLLDLKAQQRRVAMEAQQTMQALQTLYDEMEGIRKDNEARLKLERFHQLYEGMHERTDAACDEAQKVRAEVADFVDRVRELLKIEEGAMQARNDELLERQDELLDEIEELRAHLMRPA